MSAVVTHGAEHAEQADCHAGVTARVTASADVLEDLACQRS
ncbi:hypothetical protein BX266_2701 [Streptomyces sp. TLI_171]|nr:hypothetical protein BX266_2701 [Streptomyces sp. TLI_171]